MGSKRRRRTRRPARLPATRIPKRRLLVVCEGKRTEPEYIAGFERHVRNARVEIEIPKERGDPKRVVEIAKKCTQDAVDEAKRQRDDFLAFDETWCVFDRDEHDRFADACTMARDNGFELAISNPCIELWLLLHFRENPGMQSRHVVARMLRAHLPREHKGIEFSLLIDGIFDATERARRMDADAEAMGEAGRNPTTGFYRLTNAIAHTEKDDV